VSNVNRGEIRRGRKEGKHFRDTGSKLKGKRKVEEEQNTCKKEGKPAKK
jgi:hypothetical protein